jgi:hypothetical protein
MDGKCKIFLNEKRININIHAVLECTDRYEPQEYFNKNKHTHTNNFKNIKATPLLGRFRFSFLKKILIFFLAELQETVRPVARV